MLVSGASVSLSLLLAAFSFGSSQCNELFSICLVLVPVSWLLLIHSPNPHCKATDAERMHRVLEGQEALPACALAVHFFRKA